MNRIVSRRWDFLPCRPPTTSVFENFLYSILRCQSEFRARRRYLFPSLIRRDNSSSSFFPHPSNQISYSPIRKSRSQFLSSQSSTIDGPRRGIPIPSIIVNPNSRVSEIMPGGMIMKENLGVMKEKRVDLEYGHFWMMKDIRDCNSKPLLSNPQLISSSEALPFPSLYNCTTLSGVTNLSLTDRLRSPSSGSYGCTLVAISFKQYGFEMLPSWIGPFERVFNEENENLSQRRKKHRRSAISVRPNIVQIAISEGGILRLLSSIVTNSMRRNVPQHLHDNTLLHFGDGEDVGILRDVLRMHNDLPGYVVLVDGKGRVRWMGSGLPEEEEIDILVGCARNLMKGEETEDENVDMARRWHRR
uniref:Mitochondrial ATPase complex subunit ATP10 n=1 Tax=Corethron hystrix TaxID=216773 RepID=A0A7S1BRD1_9STRA|mmetsp:Transcript_36176/g.84583  ORF Transcript_36176/g.84583 Transcript_36176/m.84583 type:complete len:359 (+) Transcript_36176:107-1183(+)